MKYLIKKIFSKELSEIYLKWEERQKINRAEFDKTIPRFDLESKHIANTRILVNRQELLKLMPKNAICAEIGVDKGEFSEEILRETSPQKLFLIDAWNDQVYHNGLRDLVLKKFKNEITSGLIEIKIGYSTDVLSDFPDQFFDWIYLDTAHTYNITIAELNILKIKMKPGGIITGHDYVTGYWLGGFRYGVIEAVHELCVKDNWELIYLTNETHQHRSFALRKL